MRKKIGLMLSTKPQYGGEHQYALMVVECLLKNEDYELLVLCGNLFWRKWCEEKNIRYLGYSFPDLSVSEQQFNYKCPFMAKLYFTYLTPFGKLIRKEKVDILFSPQHGFVANYAAKLVTPAHDLMHRYEPRFPEVRSNFESRELCMKSFAKYAACILVDSNLGKKQYKESYMKTRDRRPYVISLPFVVPEHVRKAEEEYIKVPGKYVFYPAQFWKHKNHMNLVRAIKILRETIDDIHLVLVGSEKNSCKEVKKYISDNGLEHHITILGFVSNENITYLYRHAVGMVMPSYFGPTNIPPLEAMALGCPVAVSGKYAMPEQVGKAGLIFNPDSPEKISDCIRKLWTDEELREKMIRLGYERIRKWTKKEFANKLYKIIDTI